MNVRYKIIAITLLLIINLRVIDAEPIQNELNYTTGGIDHDIFYNSVPTQMRIGESHTLKVFLTNNGDIRNKFRVVLTTTKSTGPASPYDPGYKQFVYPYFVSALASLDKGESRRIEFDITPIKPYIGELEISVDLYLLRSNQNQLSSDFVLVDHASKQIRVIKPAFAIEEQIFIIVILFILAIISIILINRLNEH